MYLKRLEMVGFKSFAERTRLEFEQGITAVIGPNGCGKSNVVDAIRWCLGEMSPKSLRSKMLLDVIFNGSANRPPSNLAEVSLTFDNSNKLLPIDYSEVTVTRRLFRSGESEYFMNRTQCRLKDIKELFLDTGIGEEGYSIMEQGRVEYILNARAEERRELFEEAAGVSKYKARREESLRKLERTQIDLDRLADVIAMTKDQMDKLDMAVRKARQYQKLRDELKTMEISHWLWEIAQLDHQLQQLQDAIRSGEEKLQGETTTINQHEARLAELRVAGLELGERLVALNRQLSDIDGSIGLAEQKQRTAEEREQEIRQRDTVLDAELSAGQGRHKELESLRASLQNELDKERTDARELAGVLSQAAESHRALQRRQAELEEQARAAQEKIWQNAQERNRLHNDIGAQRSSEGRLDAELKLLQKELGKAEEKIHTAETVRQNFQTEAASRDAERQGLEENAQHAKDALTQLEWVLSGLNDRLSTLQKSFYEAKAHLDAQDQLEKNDPYAQGAHAALNAHLPGIYGTLGRLITVAPEDEAVVRQVLGTHLTDLLADTWEDAQAGIRFLAENKKGRARFLILNRLPAADTAEGQRSVLDLVQVDDRFRPAVKFLLGRWVADGHTLSGDGFLEGGSEFFSAVGHDPLRRENLQRELVRLESEMNAVSQEKAAGEARKPDLSIDWEKARHALESSRVQQSFYVQEDEKQVSAITLARQEKGFIEADIEKIQSQIQEAEQTAQNLEQRLANLAASEESLRSQWQAMQDALQSHQPQVSAAAAELAVVTERARGQEERVGWLEKQAASAEAEFSTLVAGLEAKAQERASSSERLDEQRRLQQEAKGVIEQEISRRRGVESSLESLQAERTAHHDQQADVERALAQAREDAEALRTQLQEKKIQQSHAQLRRETTENHMREKYTLSAEEAAHAHGVPGQAVDVPELEKLRRRVDNIGPVNLAAPEEHTQLEERYTFLMTQQQDLLKAKEDLLQTIQKINTTTRESFRETFEKVRENFKNIYGQLFQGGECDLRFTDESDLQNTGIDIFAQPPGKKLQNISLLSGGERALTAVSLLFAFFMVRPSPFAILDEVDAPLDEANVTRYVTLIRNFVHQSQFIMITHNKRSMEMADTLYGVTMETLGVSKILSARLKKEGQAAMSGKTSTPEFALTGKSGA